LVVDQRAQPCHAGADQRDGVCIGGVGLAALPGGEHSRPGGQLWWDIHDLLAIGQQPVGDVPADSLAALDRPDPVRPPPGVRLHRGVAVAVGVEAAAADDGLVAGHDLDRG
jgi:hypothetical protein